MKATYQKPTTEFSIAVPETLLVEGSIIGGGPGGPGVAEGKSFFSDDEEEVNMVRSVWDD